MHNITAQAYTDSEIAGYIYIQFKSQLHRKRLSICQSVQEKRAIVFARLYKLDINDNDELAKLISGYCEYMYDILEHFLYHICFMTHTSMTKSNGITNTLICVVLGLDLEIRRQINHLV